MGCDMPAGAERFLMSHGSCHDAIPEGKRMEIARSTLWRGHGERRKSHWQVTRIAYGRARTQNGLPTCGPRHWGTLWTTSRHICCPWPDGNDVMTDIRMPLSEPPPSTCVTWATWSSPPGCVASASPPCMRHSCHPMDPVPASYVSPSTREQYAWHHPTVSASGSVVRTRFSLARSSV